MRRRQKPLRPPKGDVLWILGPGESPRPRQRGYSGTDSPGRAAASRKRGTSRDERSRRAPLATLAVLPMDARPTTIALAHQNRGGTKGRSGYFSTRQAPLCEALMRGSISSRPPKGCVSWMRSRQEPLHPPEGGVLWMCGPGEPPRPRQWSYSGTDSPGEPSRPRQWGYSGTNSPGKRLRPVKGTLPGMNAPAEPAALHPCFCQIENLHYLHLRKKLTNGIYFSK